MSAATRTPKRKAVEQLQPLESSIVGEVVAKLPWLALEAAGDRAFIQLFGNVYDSKFLEGYVATSRTGVGAVSEMVMTRLWLAARTFIMRGVISPVYRPYGVNFWAELGLPTLGNLDTLAHDQDARRRWIDLSFVMSHLQNSGDVYSTIDDAHYKATPSKETKGFSDLLLQLIANRRDRRVQTFTLLKETLTGELRIPISMCAEIVNLALGTPLDMWKAQGMTEMCPHLLGWFSEPDMPTFAVVI